MATRPVIVLLSVVATLMFALLAGVYRQGTRSSYVHRPATASHSRLALSSFSKPAAVDEPRRDLKLENELLAEKVRKLELELLKKQEGAMAQAATAAAAPAPSTTVAETRPANASDYRLTPALIRDRCDENNIILVTFVNAKRVDYAYTWDAHVRRLKLRNYLIGGMDQSALRLLVERGIPAFDMESGLTTSDYGWGTKAFRKLGLRKTELILSLLRAGADPILTDADALITRDPSPYVRRFLPEAQVLVTSDHLKSTVADDGLENPHMASHSAWNIGYFYLHHSVLPAMLHWAQMCADHPNLWDQNLFKDVLKIGGLHIGDAPPELQKKRLFLGYNRSVVIGILPVSTFCSGHTFFVQRMPQQRGVLPYSVHTTFQYSGSVGKTHRLREAMLWVDEPSYYDPKSNLLAYVPSVRFELAKPAGEMDTLSHFQLVHEQLRQLRAAFLLAAALGRILVLPRLACGLDRFWAPHNGSIPGSSTKLPVSPCPADHVLDLEGMARSRDLAKLLREYSFLRNARTPAALLASTRTLEPPRSLSAVDLQPLRDLQSARVLNFTSMPDLYHTLSVDEAAAAQRDMKGFTSLWCCSEPPTKKSAGHIWYDMFWDVPHKDKHGREWTEPWRPVFGP